MPEIDINTRAGSKMSVDKAIAGSAVTFVLVSVIVGGIQAALDANLIGELPPYLSGPLLALLPAVLNFAAVWLKRNRPV